MTTGGYFYQNSQNKQTQNTLNPESTIVIIPWDMYFQIKYIKYDDLNSKGTFTVSAWNTHKHKIDTELCYDSINQNGKIVIILLT